MKPDTPAHRYIRSGGWTRLRLHFGSNPCVDIAHRNRSDADGVSGEGLRHGILQRQPVGAELHHRHMQQPLHQPHVRDRQPRPDADLPVVFEQPDRPAPERQAAVGAVEMRIAAVCLLAVCTMEDGCIRHTRLEVDLLAAYYTTD